MAAVCRGRGGVGEGEGGALTSHGGGAAQIRPSSGFQSALGALCSGPQGAFLENEYWE
uniref:Uncharacterized protein n=1 Tax=Aegilops tauschii subsp. strangulata TaxID=200361 RepID=A0A453HLD4_AEGTS